MKKILQRVIVTLLAVVEIAASAAFNTRTFAAPTIQDTILTQINTVRIQKGLSALEYDAELTGAAQTRAKESSFFYSHKRPDGSDWYTVNKSAMGENLYEGDEYFSPADYCVSMWTQSAGHYEVMTLDYVTRAGIGVYYADGTYYICLEVG